MGKQHDFCLRVTGSNARLSTSLGKRLKGVRRIYLREYHIEGLAAAGASRTWMISLDDIVLSDQTTSFSGRGFAISAMPDGQGAGNLRKSRVYPSPILIANHGIPVMTDISFRVTDHAGQPVVFTEFALWLSIVYDDEYTDLDVVAAEAGIGRTTTGVNDWRTGRFPSKAGADHIMNRLQQHLFSQQDSINK